MNRSPQDESATLLARANPVDDEVAEGLLSESAAAAMLERITHDPAAGRTRTRRRGAAVATALAASALGAWALLAWTGDGPSGFPALEQAAAAAQAGPPPIATQGPVRYESWRSADLVTVVRSGDSFSALVERRVESWTGPSGRALLRYGPGRPRFLGPADADAWRAAGSPPMAASTRSEVSRDESIADLRELAALAGDPHRLLAAVRARGGAPIGDDPVQTVVRVADLLRDPGAPPELRSGLYRALALVPGLELEENAADPAGRPGVSYAVTGDRSGVRTMQRLIFDPETSRLLAEETVLLEKVDWVDAEPPARIGSRTILADGIAQAAGKRPTGGPGDEAGG